MTDIEAGSDAVEALNTLLAQFPDARVSAHSADGQPIAIPPSVPLRSTHVRGTALSVRAWLPEDRLGVISAFEEACSRGTSQVSARLANDPTAACTLYLLDVRQVYGAIITVAVGQSGATASKRLAEIDRDRDTPRLARVTKSGIAAILSIDEATTDILGWSEQEMVGHRSLEFIHPDDQALALETWFELLATPGLSRRSRLRHKTRLGAWTWFEITNNNLLQSDEQCVISEMVDISKEMAAQELLTRLTQALPLGVFQIDSGCRIVYSNSRLADMQLPSTESLDDLLLLADARNEKELVDAVDAVLHRHADRDLEVELRLPGHGQPRQFQLNLRSLTKQSNESSGAIGCLADVTESVLLRRELEHRATYDTLTGCHNRQSITTALQALLNAPIQPSAGIGVFFIDLDKFKAVNDTLGHTAGDQLLRIVADRLRHLTRGHDLVGRVARVGRLGGDEFLLVCPELPDEQAALALARRIVATLSGPVQLSSGTAQLGASIGFAWTSPGLLDEETLVNHADTAMYAAKRAGTGHPCRYTAELESERQSGPAAAVPPARGAGFELPADAIAEPNAIGS